MWNWIASESKKQKRIVTKYDFFVAHDIKDFPYNECYLCQYIFELCSKHTTTDGYISRNDFGDTCKLHCPLDFCGLNVPFSCEEDGSPYFNWWKIIYKVGRFDDTEFDVSDYAKQIAELPERKVGVEVD